MEKYYRVSDVKEIIKTLAREPYYQHEGESFYNGVCAVDGELACLDIVTLEEQKVGRWLFSEYGGISYYQCSCCDYDLEIPLTYTKDDVKKYRKYCTNCGAKMSGE